LLTRAYFTAATCATSSFKILSIALFKNKAEITPPQFLSKNLIIWNTTENSSFRLQKGILTKKIRDNFILTNYHKSIIIGLLLSEGTFRKKKNWNPRISLTQSIKNIEYLWSVFNTLSLYCSSLPFLNYTFKRGKLFFCLEFQTRMFKSLNELYKLYYIENTKIKIITPDLFHYIDYVSIAHWIQGEGAKRNKGIILGTDCFTIKEVVLIMNILLIKFNISSTILYINNRPKIYLKNKELNKIKSEIKPFFVQTFLYKIHC
jgi:hypothetical protein